jgi:hypothetical protein
MSVACDRCGTMNFKVGARPIDFALICRDCGRILCCDCCGREMVREIPLLCCDRCRSLNLAEAEKWMDRLAFRPGGSVLPESGSDDS